MKFSAVLALAGTAAAFSNVTTTTVIEDVYVTVCPASSTWEYGGHTYTVTGTSTITVTDCPCTLKVWTPPPTTVTTEVCPPRTVVYPNGTVTLPGTTTYTTTYVSTCAPSTSLVGVTPVGSPAVTTTPSATKTPIAPSSTPSKVVTAGASKAQTGAGVLAAAAMALYLL